MAITATITSTIPVSSGIYIQSGNAPIPVKINVFNSSPSPVTLKQLYLTQDNTALGTGAGLSLGEPTFRYIGSSLNTTNNVIAGNSSYSYDALFAPQVNALTYYNSPEAYTFNITAVVQEFGSASTTRATPATFIIKASAFVGLSALSQYYTWSLTDNARPPNYVDFDFQVSANRLLKSGEVVASPINQLTFTSSNPAVATIVANSPTQNSDISGNLTPSGGCVRIIGVGSTTITAGESGYGSDAFILNVVDALPVGLVIDLPFQNFFFTTPTQSTASRFLKFKAYLLKSNGSIQDISNFNIWSVSNSAILQSLRPITGNYEDYQINPASPVNAYGFTQVQVTAKYQGFTATAFINAIIR
jgi:hypothetical protein